MQAQRLPSPTRRSGKSEASLRICCLGGGPAGLHFAGLVRRGRPEDEVVVIERERADHAFGFGVVFSDPTLDYLRKHDPGTCADLLAHCRRWDAIETRLRGSVVRCHGQGFSAIARKALLSLLQARAEAAGVELRFETEVGGPALDRLIEDYDLIVAAEGVSSGLRRKFGDHFRPRMITGSTKFIWFGTTQRFDCLTFLFARNEHGAFAVHAYPFDDHTSTFIVETDEAAWRRAGLDRADGDLRSMEYCRSLFADELGDHQLLANESRWQSFRTLSNETWRSGKIVLMGDAAHTAHFSVGSGTKMAMEDAIALSRALCREPDVASACAQYEEERRADVERIQRTAGPSLAWWESFGHTMHFDPEQFAFHFLTRNLRLGRQSLQRRDPDFVAALDAWSSRTFDRESILEAPLCLRGVTLRNRIVSSGASVTAATFPEAGLRMIARTALSNGSDAVERARRGRADTHVGLRLESVGSSVEECVLAAREAADAGIDFLELPETLASIAAVRGAWPANKPLAVRVRARADALEVARAHIAAGCDLITLVPDGDERQGPSTRDACLAESDRIRNQARASTCIFPGNVPTLDEAETALIAGRCDLIRLE